MEKTRAATTSKALLPKVPTSKVPTSKVPSKKAGNTRRLVTLWHKRLGIVCALFVILLSVTGILLNHTSAFSLDKRFISSPVLLNFYSVEAPPLRSFTLGDSWLSEADSRLYVGDQYVGECEGKLVGSHSTDLFWVAVCSHSLVLFTAENERVEKVGESFGLPTPISRSGSCASGLCVQVAKDVYAIDLDEMTWDRSALNADWQQASRLSNSLKKSIHQQATANLITLEKLILDIHAGRYFGAVGPFFMDLVAVLLILLSLTGMYLWLRKGKRRS